MAGHPTDGPTCGDHGGVTKNGDPCSRGEEWGIHEGMEKGLIPGRCKHHREGGILSPNEKRFVDVYCGRAKMNQTRAARIVYGDVPSAYAMGYEVAKRPHVRKAIDERLEAFAMSEAEVLARLAETARGSMEPFMRVNEDGEITVDLTSEEARDHIFMIRELTQEEHIADYGDGDNPSVFRRKTKLKLHDAKDAQKYYARILGLLVNKHEVTGKDGGPIETLDVGELRNRISGRLARAGVRATPDGDIGELHENGAPGS